MVTSSKLPYKQTEWTGGILHLRHFDKPSHIGHQNLCAGVHNHSGCNCQVYCLCTGSKYYVALTLNAVLVRCGPTANSHLHCLSASLAQLWLRLRKRRSGEQKFMWVHALSGSSREK
ncbi:hypothetical protein CHARACLAT_030296 [Characodon lateralis]|uniref:Uncharacterized protein n=1 Tax=Characodon lateralis TaxID=208331 RepID=A0ABU7ENW0_9TELE|nr:hypothetical protein [Characodon lateralis]